MHTTICFDTSWWVIQRRGRHRCEHARPTPPSKKAFCAAVAAVWKGEGRSQAALECYRARCDMAASATLGNLRDGKCVACKCRHKTEGKLVEWLQARLMEAIITPSIEDPGRHVVGRPTSTSTWPSGMASRCSSNSMGPTLLGPHHTIPYLAQTMSRVCVLLFRTLSRGTCLDLASSIVLDHVTQLFPGHFGSKHTWLIRPGSSFTRLIGNIGPLALISTTRGGRENMRSNLYVKIKCRTLAVCMLHA